MDTLLTLGLAWVVSLILNLAPAFMPPTWAVLAVFKVTRGLPLLPLTIGGAAASAAGRVGLALLSQKLGAHLPASDRRNAEAIGAFIRNHGHWSAVIVFLGCLGPLPSNAIFIAAGLGRISLRPVVIAFFLSRAVADTFWVMAAGRVSQSAQGLFREQITSWPAIALQVGALFLVVGALRLPWARWLGAGDTVQPAG
jgi:uncharacterized membrane protein YdjX (TVP38/TMEM64 family)